MSDPPKVSSVHLLGRIWTAAKRGQLLAVAFVVFAATFAWLNRNWLDHAADSIAVTDRPGTADGQLIVWVLNWVALRLRSDFTSIVDAPINYPALGQLTGSEHFATSQLLFFPMNAVVDNPLLAANLSVMLTYPLTALAMFALSTSLGVRPLPALFGGFCLALGSLQVPGNLHILQTLPIFFPLTAIALHRLRDDPRATRVAVCALSYLAGLMSSFYVAMLLSVFYSVWVLVECSRPQPGRSRFLFVAGAVMIAMVAVFLAISLPYLQHADIGTERPMLWTPQLLAQRKVTLLLRALSDSKIGVGIAATVAGVLGLYSLSEPEFRRYSYAAIALALIGLFVAAGGLQQLAYASFPGLLGDVFLFMGQFFRVTPRGLALTGFAFAILGALGLETARRRSRSIGVVASAVMITALLATRGPILASPVIVPVRAFTEYRAVYSEVARITSQRAGGSMLELPRRPSPREHDASYMMGQIFHGVPLITGHTGYLPRSRAEVDRLARTPIGDAALEQLIVTNKLRWILVHPESEWSSGRRYRVTVRQLRLSRMTAIVRPIEGFLLVELKPSAADHLGSERS